jgi:hypothetical protein
MMFVVYCQNNGRRGVLSVGLFGMSVWEDEDELGDRGGVTGEFVYWRQNCISATEL